MFVAERAMLLRLFSARLGNRDEAEDALQDMWLKLDALPPKPVAQPAAYLFRMATNLAADRRISATRGGARDHAWHEAQPAAEELPDIERTMIARERLAQVDAALAAMPERMSAALRMFRVEELSQKLIAERLGITISGVEKLLQRGYRQLAEATAANAKINGAGLSAPRRLADEEDFSL